MPPATLCVDFTTMDLPGSFQLKSLKGESDQMTLELSLIIPLSKEYVSNQNLESKD